MNSETGNEFEAEYHDRVRTIRRAAAIALKELDRLRSGGLMTQEALDAEVARIARENLRPYGCNLVVHRIADGLTRSFLRNLGLGAALLVPGAALLSGSNKALAANGRERLNAGDVAILQLLAAAELIEADLWQQYKELGGVDAPDSGYKAGLVILDGDQPQYISDNTDDELSHAAFLNAYLRSKGERQVNLKQFARLPPSQVSFVPQTGRLTNLKQLTVDTSWWTRYRSTTNPDFGATFPNAVPSLDIGLHTAIPRSD